MTNQFCIAQLCVEQDNNISFMVNVVHEIENNHHKEDKNLIIKNTYALAVGRCILYNRKQFNVCLKKKLFYCS